MPRLVRLLDDSGEHETVMILGGEHGVVTLHVSLCGIPQAQVLHSPREFPGWNGPRPCRRMEVPCWSLVSITGEEMAALLELRCLRTEDSLWLMMENAYNLYLKGGRR